MDSNPLRAERDWPPAIIASAGQTGVLLMRDLARRGVTTCCFDCDRANPGFHTRYGRGHECPNPDEEPDRWLQFMIDFSRTFDRKPVLISCADQFVSAMAEHAQKLESRFIFCHSTIGLQGMLATKQKQYELAAEHGMPVPRTRYVESEDEVRGFASTARFPCILKPLHCREWEPLTDGHPLRWRKAVSAGSPEELLALYRMAAEISPRVVLQEMIEGPDTAKVVYMACYGQGGERIGSCLLRILRTSPIGFGSASVVEPVSDPETDSVCDAFLRSLGYVGLCEIELKRDSRDGRLQMIEANPRYTGTADAVPYAGVEVGWLHYLDLIGQKVTYVGTSRWNFRHIILGSDLGTIGSYRRAGLETWGSWLHSYRPPIAFYDIDFRDWRVTARALVNIAKMIVRPAYRRVFPKRRPKPG